MDITWRDIVGVAVIIPVLSAVVLWTVKRVGRWLTAALTASFASTVSEVMAPDLIRMGVRLGQSIDELKLTNSAQHVEVEHRLSEVEHRLAAVESKLATRSPDARTRATDKEN